MHDRLFEGAGLRDWSQGGGPDFQTFLGYAAELRLDVPRLRRCVQDNAHAPTIEADYRDGVRLGVRSTPSFLINGKLLIGAHPYATWRRIFDDLLAKP